MGKKSEETQIDLPGDGRWKKPIMIYEVRSESNPHSGLPQTEAGKPPVCETEHINSFNEWIEHGFI